MGKINVEMLLKPVSAESPCGDDLRYDGRYLEVLRLSEGKPEQVMGDTVIPGEEPDWREVRDGCFELFGRAKDLRIAVLLCVSSLRMEGFAGLRDSFAVLRGMLEQYWEALYPRLDPEDNNDPTERVNIIAAMAVPVGSFGDPLKFIDRIREAPLCESKSVGKITLKDIAIAMGEVPPASAGAEDPNASKPKDMALINAAFAEVEIGPLEAMAKVVEECLEHAKGIDATLTKWVGLGKAADLSGLRTVIADAAKAIRSRIPGGGGGAESEAGEGAGAGDEGGGGGERLAGEVRSADDVLMALEKIVKYYERSEPSSPVPLIVRCAEQMVRKPFLDIVRVLKPDVVEMLEGIMTPQTEEK